MNFDLNEKFKNPTNFESIFWVQILNQYKVIMQNFWERLF